MKAHNKAIKKLTFFGFITALKLIVELDRLTPSASIEDRLRILDAAINVLHTSQALESAPPSP